MDQSAKQWRFDKDPNSGYTTKPEDYIFNVTEWLSYSVAPGVRYCFNIGLDAYTFYLIKDEQFGGFSDWFPAWLQSLLGNVITFNSLYTKIKEATDAGNQVDALYWYGKLAYIIIDFEPIASTADEFDSSTSDDWWNRDS